MTVVGRQRVHRGASRGKALVTLITKLLRLRSRQRERLLRQAYGGNPKVQKLADALEIERG